MHAADTKNALLISQHRLLACVGLEDVVVVETPDAVMVARKDKAQAVGELAQRRHWNSIILVTSRYHMFRASRIFRRCIDARIAEHGVDEPWWRDGIAVPLEWLKLGIAETIRRNC